MRIPPRLLVLFLGLWGLGLVWLGRHLPGSCSSGVCGACGACFRPPPSAAAPGDTVG